MHLLGFVKINVDVAFFVYSLETGMGMAIHDDYGEFICCHSLVRPGVLKVDEGEAWGIKEAIRWAANLGFERVVVESDSKWVVDAMKAWSYWRRKTASRGPRSFLDLLGV